VTEILPGNIAENLPFLSFDDKRRIMKGLARGMQALHKNNYLHLDCKLENGMFKEINRKIEGVLIDYKYTSYVKGGIEKGIVTEQQRFAGPYKAPECLKPVVPGKYYYNNKSDIWALGATFIRILNNNNNYFFAEIFNDLREGKYTKLEKFYLEFMNQNKIQEFVGVLVDGIGHPEMKNEAKKNQIKGLLVNMFQLNPRLRSSIEDVLNHPFFDVLKEEDKEFDEKLIIPNVSLKDVKQSLFVHIFDILDVCTRFMPEKNIGVFFLAVDLFLRYIYAKNDGSFEIARDCCFSAMKVFYWSEFDKLTLVQLEYISQPDFMMNEIKIYKAVKGRIWDERYYTNAKSRMDLARVYKEMIEPYSDVVTMRIQDESKNFYDINKEIVNYLNTDAKAFFLKYSTGEEQDLTSLSIEDFFRK
jgi:serine/threonine protein kinase